MKVDSANQNDLKEPFEFQKNMMMIEMPIHCCTFPRCGKQFKSAFSLKRHMLTHSSNKPFQCPYCPKTFALQQYMLEHSYTHTLEKPYVCGVNGCQERFRQAGKLSLHRRTHPEYVVKSYNYDLNPKKKSKAKKQCKDDSESWTMKRKRKEGDLSKTIKPRSPLPTSLPIEIPISATQEPVVAPIAAVALPVLPPISAFFDHSKDTLLNAESHDYSACPSAPTVCLDKDTKTGKPYIPMMSALALLGLPWKMNARVVIPLPKAHMKMEVNDCTHYVHNNIECADFFSGLLGTGLSPEKFLSFPGASCSL